MPFILLLSCLVFFVFASPIPAFFADVPQRVSNTPSVELAQHYTRGGVVLINPRTMATRFIPYRAAENLDRRNSARGMA